MMKIYHLEITDPLTPPAVLLPTVSPQCERKTPKLYGLKDPLTMHFLAYYFFPRKSLGDLLRFCINRKGGSNDALLHAKP